MHHPQKFLNSAFLLTGQGITAKYDKIHLVPFGEYVPLGWLIGFVRSWAEFISDFAAGRAETIFPLAGAPFGTVICYEVIFPELFRDFVAGGATFMVNITNDAWFGRTSGPWQHLGMLPLRAVEHRVGDRACGQYRRLRLRRAERSRASHAAALRTRGPASSHAATDAHHALHAVRRLGRLRLSRPRGGRFRTRILSEVSRDMLGELKRDVTNLEKRLDDLRGHL